MPKSPKVPSKDSVEIHDQRVLRGEGGELHQTAEDGFPVLTTAQGRPIADDHNSLKIGSRGPVVLEDFHFREKIDESMLDERPGFFVR